jgi:hypothetical protein
MNGNHTITAVVRDAAGNSATSAGITVTVNNAPASTAGTKTVLNVRSASSDGGYARILLGKYGTPTDHSSKPTRSTFGSLKTARSFARRTVYIVISATSAGVVSATGVRSTAAASRCALPAPTTAQERPDLHRVHRPRLRHHCRSLMSAVHASVGLISRGSRSSGRPTLVGFKAAADGNAARARARWTERSERARPALRDPSAHEADGPPGCLRTFLGSHRSERVGAFRRSLNAMPNQPVCSGFADAAEKADGSGLVVRHARTRRTGSDQQCSD